MVASFSNVVHWILATVFVFGSLRRSGKNFIWKFKDLRSLRTVLFFNSKHLSLFWVNRTLILACILWLCCVVFNFLAFTEGFQWTSQPDNPTIVVQGVNSSVVTLIWRYDLRGAQINAVFIKRGSSSIPLPITIATKVGNRGFNVLDSFKSDYRAFSDPVKLELLNVDNKEEYFYFIQFQYFFSDGTVQDSNSRQVQIDVKGT